MTSEKLIELASDENAHLGEALRQAIYAIVDYYRKAHDARLAGGNENAEWRERRAEGDLKLIERILRGAA